jgi:hypothetical protein
MHPLHWVAFSSPPTYGTEENGFFIDAYVTFQKKGLRKVIHALRRHGYICRRAGRKISAAMGN